MCLFVDVGVFVWLSRLGMLTDEPESLQVQTHHL